MWCNGSCWHDIWRWSRIKLFSSWLMRCPLAWGSIYIKVSEQGRGKQPYFELEEKWQNVLNTQTLREELALGTTGYTSWKVFPGIHRTILHEMVPSLFHWRGALLKFRFSPNFTFDLNIYIYRVVSKKFAAYIMHQNFLHIQARI